MPTFQTFGFFKILFTITLCLGWAEARPKAAAESPIVTIPQGSLQGEVITSRDGRPFNSFKGIPYGKSERYQYSQPADSWVGLRNATEFGSVCLQIDTFKNAIVGTEDCLFLNVYIPQRPENSSALPVLFFIHGGSFFFGSGEEYGPDYFMDEDIILVTINYRVGLFGFVQTSLGSNFGLKDQVLALKWARDNIPYFGGDPNAVTIFGESAGAWSVALHILSPMSKGLFARGISNSGTAIQTNTVLYNPARELKKLGVMMDCPTSTPLILTDCLKRLNGRSMLERFLLAYILPGFKAEDVPAFGATVEKGQGIFLHDYPVNLLMNGDFNHVPWISGANSHEGLSFYIELALSEALRNRSNERWNEFAPEIFVYDYSNCKASTEIRKFYLGDKQIGTDEGTLGNMTNAGTDRVFLYNSKVTTALHANYAPAYQYYFSLRGPATFDPRWYSLNASTDGLAPPSHIDELQYLFNTQYYPKILQGSPFKAFSNWFVKTWADFAKDGSTPEQWEAVRPNTTQAEVQWFQIDAYSRMVLESDILNDRLTFWPSIFPIQKS